MIFNNDDLKLTYLEMRIDEKDRLYIDMYNC